MQIPVWGGVGAAWIYSIVTTGPTFGRMNTLDRNQECHFCSETRLLCRSGRDTGGKNNFCVSSSGIPGVNGQYQHPLPPRGTEVKDLKTEPQIQHMGGKLLLRKLFLRRY